VICCPAAGLYAYENNKLTRIKVKQDGTRILFRPHGVSVGSTFLGAEIIFATTQPVESDPADSFIGVVRVEKGKLSIHAGSNSRRCGEGKVGAVTGDGPASRSRFQNPFGVSAWYSNVMVVDGDRIRLITPTKQCSLYLQLVLGVATAFGMKQRDGESRLPTKTVSQCIVELSLLSHTLEIINSQAADRVGNHRATNGSDCSFGNETRRTLKRIIMAL